MKERNKQYFLSHSKVLTNQKYHNQSIQAFRINSVSLRNQRSHRNLQAPLFEIHYS